MRSFPLTRMAAALAATALAASVLLTGCGLNRPAASETPTGIVVSPIVTEATPSATASLAPVADLPAGHKWVATAGHGVKFAVPEAWSMVDLSSFSDPAAKEALKPIAERLGKTIDEYIAELTANDLMIAGPEVNGYASLISVPKEEAQSLGDLPTQEQAQAALASVQATVTAVTPVTTALGPVHVIAYSTPGTAAGSTVYCARLELPTVKNTAFLMVIESNAVADRDSLVTGVVTTLQKA